MNRDITQEGVDLIYVKLLINQVMSTSNYNAFKIPQEMELLIKFLTDGYSLKFYEWTLTCLLCAFPIGTL